MTETNVAQNIVAVLDKPLDLQIFTPEEIQRIEKIAVSIDVEDSQAVMEYGIGAQSDIARFSDVVLNEVRAKDSGYVGDILSQLMVTAKELDVDSLKSVGGIFSGIKNRVRKFVARYQKLSTEIDSIVDELDKAKTQLTRDVVLLDNLYEKNIEYMKELEVYIAAGEMYIRKLYLEVVPELEVKVKSQGDAVDAQKLNDLKNLVNRFEKKVHDLKLSRMIAIQSGPQIRLVQNNDQVLIERIQSTILNTIPLWKNQIVIAITLFRQKKALKLQK